MKYYTSKKGSLKTLKVQTGAYRGIQRLVWKAAFDVQRPLGVRKAKLQRLMGVLNMNRRNELTHLGLLSHNVSEMMDKLSVAYDERWVAQIHECEELSVYSQRRNRTISRQQGAVARELKNVLDQIDYFENDDLISEDKDLHFEQLSSDSDDSLTDSNQSAVEWAQMSEEAKEDFIAREQMLDESAKFQDKYLVEQLEDCSSSSPFAPVNEKIDKMTACIDKLIAKWSNPRQGDKPVPM